MPMITRSSQPKSKDIKIEKPEKKNALGESDLMVACNRKRRKRAERQEKAIRKFEKLLIDGNPNSIDHAKNTVASVAVLNLQSEMFQILFENGANVNLRSGGERNLVIHDILHMMFGDPSRMDIIIPRLKPYVVSMFKTAIDFKVDMNAKNRRGETGISLLQQLENLDESEEVDQMRMHYLRSMHEEVGESDHEFGKIVKEWMEGINEIENTQGEERQPSVDEESQEKPDENAAKDKKDANEQRPEKMVEYGFDSQNDSEDMIAPAPTKKPTDIPTEISSEHHSDPVRAKKPSSASLKRTCDISDSTTQDWIRNKKIANVKQEIKSPMSHICHDTSEGLKIQMPNETITVDLTKVKVEFLQEPDHNNDNTTVTNQSIDVSQKARIRSNELNQTKLLLQLKHFDPKIVPTEYPLIKTEKLEASTHSISNVANWQNYPNNILLTIQEDVQGPNPSGIGYMLRSVESLGEAVNQSHQNVPSIIEQPIPFQPNLPQTSHQFLEQANLDLSRNIYSNLAHPFPTQAWNPHANPAAQTYLGISHLTPTTNLTLHSTAPPVFDYSFASHINPSTFPYNQTTNVFPHNFSFFPIHTSPNYLNTLNLQPLQPPLLNFSQNQTNPWMNNGIIPNPTHNLPF